MLSDTLEWMKDIPRPYTMKRVSIWFWSDWSILFEDAPILYPCHLISRTSEAKRLCDMLNGAYLMGWSACHSQNEYERYCEERSAAEHLSLWGTEK